MWSLILCEGAKKGCLFKISELLLKSLVPSTLPEDSSLFPAEENLTSRQLWEKDGSRDFGQTWESFQPRSVCLEENAELIWDHRVHTCSIWLLFLSEWNSLLSGSWFYFTDRLKNVFVSSGNSCILWTLLHVVTEQWPFHFTVNLCWICNLTN